MGDVKPMAQKRTTVAVPTELYESIEPLIKEATGIKPVVADFVADAIREKLNTYREKVNAERAALGRQAASG